MDQDCIYVTWVYNIYIYIYITHMILHFMVFNMLPRAMPRVNHARFQLTGRIPLAKSFEPYGARFV